VRFFFSFFCFSRLTCFDYLSPSPSSALSLETQAFVIQSISYKRFVSFGLGRYGHIPSQTCACLYQIRYIRSCILLLGVPAFAGWLHILAGTSHSSFTTTGSDMVDGWMDGRGGIPRRRTPVPTHHDYLKLKFIDVSGSTYSAHLSWLCKGVAVGT
jgi:hypothetical protein